MEGLDKFREAFEAYSDNYVIIGGTACDIAMTGTAWREDHERHPILYDGMERVLCPRVHFKLIIIDSAIAYVGSANLTGAGMGMKSSRRRNFEAGILTDDPKMVEAAIEQFDNVWMGKFCKDCGRRDYCADPIK